MALPKQFRNNINLNPSKVGVARRKELEENIRKNGTYLPKSVDILDMDTEMIQTIKDKFTLTVDGAVVPVIFLTIQRWSEFTKTWEFTDENKNIKIPFITIIRRPDVQIGSNQSLNYNIPGHPTFTYSRVMTFDGVRNGVDLYKIDQPTSCDLTFEVRLFSTRLKDLNAFNEMIQIAFNARQYYIWVKEHPMPVLLENISDESEISDIENRRFYVQTFEMKLLGYILKDENMRIVPSLNRILAFTEIKDTPIYKNITFTPVITNTNCFNYSFIFQNGSSNTFTFNSNYNLNITQLTNIENISRITLTVNGITVFDGTILTTPITVNTTDTFGIRIYKTGNNNSFQLQGTTF